MKKLFLIISLFLAACSYNIEYTRFSDFQLTDVEIIDQYISFTISMYNSSGGCNWKAGDFFFELKDNFNVTIKKGNIYIRKFKTVCMNLDDSSEIYIGDKINDVYFLDYKYINYDNEISLGRVLIRNQSVIDIDD